MIARLLVQEKQLPALRAVEIGDAVTRLVQGLHLARVPLSTTMRTIEKRYIEYVLEVCGGNKVAAARELDMHRNTLDRYIAVLKIKYWHFNRPGRYATRSKRKELYASKERSAQGDLRAERPALAPSSADCDRREKVNAPGEALHAAPAAFTNSVRKGGRAENSPEPSRGGKEVASASTAHLAKSSKPPRGLTFADFQFEDPDLECGGLNA